MDKGGKIHWEGLRKDTANGDALEIDVRDSQVSDAELDDIITLMGPKGRVRLGNCKITEDGAKNSGLHYRPAVLNSNARRNDFALATLRETYFPVRAPAYAIPSPSHTP